MSLKPVKVQFNGGELSPWLEGRYDIAKFDKTAKLCRNFIPMTEGTLKRRGGSRFVFFAPNDEYLRFVINVVPMEAEVIINGVYCNSIEVSRGEWVSFEVRAEGYIPIVEKKFIENDTYLDVKLVSKVQMYKLVINVEPFDAVVKIEGIERREGEFYANSEVYYIVKKDGYVSKSGIVCLDKDMVIDVVLEEVEDNEYNQNYGDWGKPEGFIACTAVFNLEVQKKCILLRFENGYLPIVFAAKKTVPNKSEIDESLFMYCDIDGADAVVERDGKYILSCIKRKNDGIYYYDLDGKLCAAIDNVSMKVCGWQVEEDGLYATSYKTYDGDVSGKFINIYYKNELVLTLDGRW